MADERDLRSIRRDYAGAGLSRADLPAEPLSLFDRWLEQASKTGLRDATAMALATVDASAVPSVRIVLLKSHGPDGFVFYTDASSQKGRDLAANPNASAVFYWPELDHQVRVTGTVTRLDPEASAAYFETRPVESRFSAAASEQSQPVANRRTVEVREAALRARYPNGDVPMPQRWGGFRLVPRVIEFWQGREGRLHDRFRYTATDAGWEIERLQP